MEIESTTKSNASFNGIPGAIKFRVMKSLGPHCEQSVACPHVWAFTHKDAQEYVEWVMGASYFVTDRN